MILMIRRGQLHDLPVSLLKHLGNHVGVKQR